MIKIIPFFNSSCRLSPLDCLQTMPCYATRSTRRREFSIWWQIGHVCKLQQPTVSFAVYMYVCETRQSKPSFLKFPLTPAKDRCDFALGLQIE